MQSNLQKYVLREKKHGNKGVKGEKKGNRIEVFIFSSFSKAHKNKETKEQIKDGSTRREGEGKRDDISSPPK